MPYEKMTPLAIVANAYDDLAHGVTPLTCEAEIWPGFSEGLKSIADLEDVLMGSGTRTGADSNKIWRQLIVQSRRQGSSWTLVCLGLAMPGLRNAAKRALFLAADQTQRADIESATLTGFTQALQGIDLDHPTLCRKLCNCAYIEARRLAIKHVQYNVLHTEDTHQSMAPKPQSRHVDLLLGEAIAQGVLSKSDAELIATSRIERQSLADIGKAESVHPSVLSRRRVSAERRLVAWITREYPGPDSDLVSDGGKGKMKLH